MISQGKWEYSVAALFLALCLLLLIIMAVQYSFGANYRTELIDKLKHSESTGFLMPEIPDYEFDTHNIENFHDIVERPLFFKARKPIEPVENIPVETVVASEKLSFILTGIINTPKGLYCLLQNLRAKEKKDRFKRLEEGDEVEGWVVNEIHPDHVVISADGKSEEIKLAKPRLKGKVPVKPRTRRTRPRRNSKRPAKNQAPNPFQRKMNRTNEIL